MKKEIDPDLSAEELADLILEKPETAEQCGRDDWLKLTGDEWARLLSEQTQLADKCRWRELSAGNWAELIGNQPQFADKCDAWDQFNGGCWALLLRMQPQLADRCDWAKLEDWNWSALLSEQPQFADKCGIWEKMSPHSIGLLLAAQPQFADQFDFTRLNGECWTRILRRQPQFADRCDWSLLDGGDWEMLLLAQPQFADKCDWTRLANEQIGELLKAHPSLADQMPMMKYIDFIDSPTVRDHLRTLPPLPPAQQCILIAQSDIKPLEEKLAALRKIRDTTSPEDFARGCWTFQSDDPFPVILDRYIKTREERLAEIRKAEPGIVYVVKSSYRGSYGMPYSTFDAALASVEELEDDEYPPSIRRLHIDDPKGAYLVAELSRKLELVEIDVSGGCDAGSMRDWGGELQNGYAHVPHPFKRGDIVRQGECYYVLDESVEDSSGRFSWGTDEGDMQLYGMAWDRACGTFGHEHICYTCGGTEIVEPKDLPEKERMLAAVANVMRDGHALIEFLQCFTNGYRDDLEENAIIWSKKDESDRKSSPSTILRSDLPGLPANLFLCKRESYRLPATVRVQRSCAAEPNRWDVVELTLEAEPSFKGGTGDLAPGDALLIRTFVARNLESFLAHFNGDMSFDDLLAALKEDEMCKATVD